MSCFNKASYGKCVMMRAVLSCTTCTSVPMGLFSGMSQSRLPAVHGRVHSFSISQRPQGPWILFSISPWWKSKSIHLIFERAWAISVIEWEQHFQAAVVSAFAYSADCIWPPLQSSYLWAEEAAVCYHLLHLSFCTRFRWEGFICIVSLGSVDFGKGWLQCGGNAHVLGWGERGTLVMVWFSHTLPCFSGWGVSQQAVVDTGEELMTLCHFENLSLCWVVWLGGFKTSEETALQRLMVDRATSLDYNLYIYLLLSCHCFLALSHTKETGCK